MTFLRNLTNSARSLSVTGVSGTSGTANAAASRIRSSLTHLPSNCSPTASSRATSAIVRPESMTR
jgi:hypothetical protein